MRVDKKAFLGWAEILGSSGGGKFGPCLEGTLLWCIKNDIPEELVELFRCCIPKTEIWAGAGTLFSELDIIKWNDWFPEALHARLIIVGSAPNGDHIAIDLVNGATGYIDHEDDWREQPKMYFIPVSTSIASYIQAINYDPQQVAQDYWDAKRGLKGS
jgi:hypothetical protein